MQNKSLFERGEVPVSCSGWTKPQGMAAKWPVLEGDAATSVAVIGAGLAGASLALHLAEAGAAVTVLEARQPGWGASGRNAGHVLPILRDLRVFERFPDGGRRFLDSFREHLTIPYDLARRYGIDCDAERSGYVNGMKSRRAFEAFMRQHAYLENAGIQQLIPLSANEMQRRLGTTAFPYGVLFADGGRVNPYLLANGMIAAAVRHGAQVHGDSEALALEQAGTRWRVRTAHGTVLADRIVLCTNAYAGPIAPELRRAYYPLTAYGLTTRPLPPEALDLIMPGGGTFAQAPIDLNPIVRDRHDRLVLSSIPRTGGAHDMAWHFQSQLRWLHQVWPAARDMAIEPESYWTGRVAMRDTQFPGAFQIFPGVFGLMFFNAWGNVMAPLMGRLMAEGLLADAPDTMPFPLEQVEAVRFPRKQEMLIRQILIPAARTAQRLKLI